MSAYNNIDTAIAGLKVGLDSHVESFRAYEAIPFGKPCFGHVGDSLNVSTFYRDVAKIVFDADFVTGNSIVITVSGTAAAAVPFNTDHDTTAADVVAAITALTGVDCLLDPADSNNRTFLIQEKHVEITAAEAITGGGSQATGTITYDTSMVFVGIAMFTQKEASASAQYAANEAVNVMTRGVLYGSAQAATVEANATAYVDTDGANRGDWSNAGFSLDGAAIYRSDAASAALAQVEVRAQKQGTYAGYAFA